ncbi:MAG: T9SS type A sorting domain-containing protein, partial [Fluviicola sp.]
SRSVNSTQKTIKTDEIIAINDRIAANANTLIQDALASEEEIDWSQFNTWVVNRGDVLCKLQLADAFLQRKQITECNTKLTEIEQEAGQITTPVVAQEMLDFVTFKRYILAITKNTGVIERLEKNQIDQLINIRDKFVGTSAVQAGNILCFYAGKCLDRELPNDNKSALQGTNETINSTSIIPSLINDLLIVPNPNSGSFTVEMLNECAVKEVLAFDALGKRVDLIQESRLNNKIDVSLIQPLTGIYIIKITCADGTTSQARLLVK